MGRARLLVLLVLAGAAPAEAAPRASDLTPRAAVPGAEVEIRGTDLEGAQLRIGGRRARVMRASARTLRVVVPKLRPGRHRVTVGRSRLRLRVPRPFTGTVRVRPRERRARTARIGAGGGRVTTRGRGVTYVLAVPPGALASETRITMTPARFGRLPFGRGAAGGVKLEPTGLVFSRPATLRLRLKRSAGRKVLGFSTDETGGSFGVRTATGSRRRLAVEVRHFSSAGAAPVTEADFVAAIAPLVGGLGQLTRGQISSLLALQAQWEQLFPGFCERQVVCGEAMERARTSLAAILVEACTQRVDQPSLQGARDLFGLAAEAQQLGVDAGEAISCAQRVFTLYANGPIFALDTGDALAPAGIEDDAPAGDVAAANLDGTPEVNRFEWVWYLAGQAQLIGLGDLGAHALDVATRALDAVRVEGLALCETDEPAGRDRLQRGSALANAIAYLVEPFQQAILDCPVRVTLAPAEASVDQTQTQQFTAEVTGTSATGVTWSATGGEVSDSGRYTPPDIPGDYVVTATSAAHPSRSDTAIVHVTCGGVPGMSASASQPRRRLAAEPETCPITVTLTLRSHAAYAMANVLDADDNIRDDDTDASNTLFTGPWSGSATAAAAIAGTASAGASTQSAVDISNSSGSLSVEGSGGYSLIGDAEPNSFTYLDGWIPVTLRFRTTGPLPYSLNATATGGRARVVLFRVGGQTIAGQTNDAGGIAVSQSGTLPEGDFQLEFYVESLIGPVSGHQQADGSYDLSLAVGEAAG